MAANFFRNWYAPEGAVRLTHKATGYIAFIYERGGKPCAAGFFPRSQKPCFQYSYSSETNREKKVREFFANGETALARKVAEREQRKADTHKLEVGTILRTSWGYDQTNVDFYKVVSIVSDKTVELIEIGRTDASKNSGYGSMAGHVVPDPDKEIGKSFRRRATSRGALIENRRYASVWEGQPCYVSWYA
jgi:hypothetical protein